MSTRQPLNQAGVIIFTMMKLHLILVLLILPVMYIHSQTSEGKKDRISSYASFGLRYKSDQYYMGRSDSIKAPYLISSLGYYHKSGLFVSGALSYLTAEQENRVDLFTLSLGYDYFGRKLATGISLDQYFFSDLSYSVQSEMRTYVSGYLAYDFNIFMVIADASLGISDNFDLFAGGEISRTFYLLSNRLLVTPSLLTNLGTQHYYNQYYEQRTLATGNHASGGNHHGTGSSASGNGSMATVSSISIKESEKFQVLDYELALQLGYNIKNFRVTTGGTVLFPVNPSTVVTPSGTYEEELENGFVWSLGIRYRLSGK